jgi:hypothetical protein
MASGGPCRFPPRDAYPGPTVPSARGMRCWPADGVPLRRPVNVRGRLDHELRGPSASRGRPTGELTSEVGYAAAERFVGEDRRLVGKDIRVRIRWPASGHRPPVALPSPSTCPQCGPTMRVRWLVPPLPAMTPSPISLQLEVPAGRRGRLARMASQSTAVICGLMALSLAGQPNVTVMAPSAPEICAPGGALSSVGSLLSVSASRRHTRAIAASCALSKICTYNLMVNPV